jgi:hypothetical protein
MNREELIAQIVHEHGPVIFDFFGEDLAWCPVEGGNWTPFESRPAPTEEQCACEHDPLCPLNRFANETQPVAGGEQIRRLFDAIEGERADAPDSTIVAFIHPNGDWSVYNGRASREILDAQLPPKPTTPERANAMEEADIERIAVGVSDKAILRLDVNEENPVLSGIIDELRDELRALRPTLEDGWETFRLGDRVEKTKGSAWHGRVVGRYRTGLTHEGYAVESEREPGSVQIYPASALRAAFPKDEVVGQPVKGEYP